jgi:transcriptional regulator with XRE-family HTH domain
MDSEPREQVLTPTLIKAARALLGMDQAAFAKAVGISRKTLSWIEISDITKLDPRRRETLERIRNVMEESLGFQFVFATETRGEGVFLRRPPKSSSRGQT